MPQSTDSGSYPQRREWKIADGREVVEQHLSRILQSPSFQGSKRCQQFLQYVVDKTLAGEGSSLKERVIGADVFDRSPDYEPSADAIVRVKANELRKRLAQYYQVSGAADGLRIELPAGSYVPTLTWQEEKVIPMTAAESEDDGPSQRLSLVPAAAATPSPATSRRIWLPLATGILVVTALALWRFGGVEEDMDRFWAPMLGSSEPVVVCMSVRDNFVLSQRMLQTLSGASRSENYKIDFALNRDDVVRIPDGQMTLASLRAVLSLSTFLGQKGQPAQFRTPAELSSEEIRKRAVILVGSFYNPWATQLYQELRYGFETANSGSQAVSWIRDATSPNERKWVADKVWPYHQQPVDYAIISRVFDTANQRVIVSAAGMSRFGAQVSGEFLTTPNYWRLVASQAPQGWERMNFQIILETKLVGMTPGPPKVVATHFWPVP